MRQRKEIEQALASISQERDYRDEVAVNVALTQINTEVLLDIRDLLLGGDIDDQGTESAEVR